MIGVHGIIRPISTSERQNVGFIEINQKTKLDIFRAEIAEHQQRCSKKFSPFCSKCCLEAYEDKVHWMIRKHNLTVSDANDQAELIESLGKIEINLEEFNDLKYFTLINEEPVFEEKFMSIGGGNASRQKIQTGVYKNYKCKEGHGHSIFISMDELKE